MITRRSPYARDPRGMTLLEIMIALAVIGGMMFLGMSAYRRVRKTDLINDTTELAQFLRRASQLSIERGELHRVVIDVEKGLYAVEVCQGTQTMVRNEAPTGDKQKTKEALEHAKQRMGQLPASAFSGAGGEPEDATRRVAALAGHHIEDKACSPVQGGVTGDPMGKKWTRALSAGVGVKFKEIWVQHQEDSATKGQVAIYFFPSGESEKAVIELEDGGDVFSVLLFGLTARVDIRDGELQNVDDHMLRNAMGEKDKAREGEDK